MLLASIWGWGSLAPSLSEQCVASLSGTGHSGRFCTQPFPCVGVLPLPPGGDAEQAPQPRAHCHRRV
uniref:Secreted protein n=1 Tax=Anas zonorhyncha TaxID=75864 RepID=A0A8B9UXN3_9AVES